MEALVVHPNAKRTPRLVLMELQGVSDDIVGYCSGHVDKDGNYVLSFSEGIDPGDIHLLGALLQEEALRMAKGLDDEDE